MDSARQDERLLRLLADARNREILTALADAGRSLRVTELAERLADGATASDRDLERLRISLHHEALPKLADAGLVEYDPERNVVARRDLPFADAERVAFDRLLERVPSSDDPAVGVLGSRADALERGRRLTESADDELFLMYVSEDLLEDECLRCARDAVDRGVDIYLGTQSPSVRDLVRRRFPEVTMWEPQFDWTTDPSSYPTVGRLVLADRERVMLALLEESADGTTEEVAVVGDGEDNPLVVLVRELLGPRLDHLDYQSEEFLGELPF